MAILLLSFCNPICLSMLLVIACFGMLLPKGSSTFGSLAVAALPLLVVIITTAWLEHVSDICKRLGSPFRIALVLLAFLFFLGDNNYFQMIAVAQQRHSLNIGQRLSLVLHDSSSVLLYSALASLLVIFVTLVLEFSFRFVAGKNATELSSLIEGIKIVLIVVACSFLSRSLLEILVRSF